PTLDDTFEMVVLEGLAHGLPVVVSGPAQCGISTLLKDSRDALLLTDPRDSKELVGTLQRLLADPALQRRLAVNGRAFAQVHTWERAAREYEKLYLASVGRKPGQDSLHRRGAEARRTQRDAEKDR
ncbi:MAG: glycosyltransferase, partial [Pseudomonadota bacterium]|nr:glycosyltransferase [Pseudomonadota bacterium]